jgi:hypothetical protein
MGGMLPFDWRVYRGAVDGDNVDDDDGASAAAASAAAANDDDDDDDDDVGPADSSMRFMALDCADVKISHALLKHAAKKYANGQQWQGEWGGGGGGGLFFGPLGKNQKRVFFLLGVGMKI